MMILALEIILGFVCIIFLAFALLIIVNCINLAKDWGKIYKKYDRDDL